MTKRALHRQLAAVGGQSTVEVAALIPVVVLVILVLVQVSWVGRARAEAASAAQAGAVALVQGQDAVDAARDALPGQRRGVVRVTVVRRRVRVQVPARSVVPGLGGRLLARAHADAGPTVAP